MKTLQLKFNDWRVNPNKWLNVLKTKMRSWDIKPAAPIAPELFKQADADYDNGDLASAIAALHRIIKACPKHRDALYGLANLYLTLGRLHEGLAIAKQGVLYHSNDPLMHQTLGTYYGYLGNLKAGAKALSRALELNPTNATTQHLLNSLLRKNTLMPPREYIERLFNSYADTYDQSLLDKLDYRAHIEVVAYLQASLAECNIDTLLDLGCGTGLLAYEMQGKIAANKIIGVDLSQNMLEKSRERGLYHELHHSDIIEYLSCVGSNHDVVTASDVLVYFGDLEKFIAFSYKALKQAGLLCFTVESLKEGSYKLDLSGRYQHSLSYITTLCNRYRYSKIYHKTIDLRKEYGNIVPGYLVLLQK